jgi:hypothetical protein
MGWVLQNIGALIRAVQGVVPLRSTGGTVNGPAIDRRGLLSAVLLLEVGATTGAPTSFTVDAKLQDSADGSTGWADIVGAAVPRITTVNTLQFVDVNLSAARAFIRAVVVDAFTGGTAPAVDRSALVVLGGADTLPQA